MTTVSDNIPWSVGVDQKAPTAHPSDVLIARCLAGDTGAHAALYQQYATYIYRLNYSLLRNREDAEEVLQDAFEYAFRRLDQYDPQKSAFKSWLYRIAISRCRNKRRRKWLPTFSLHRQNDVYNETPDTELELPDTNAVEPEAVMELSARQELVWQALSTLSDKLRETAVLRYYEGLTYQEIGIILDISPKTAESRMRLAHRALRERLEGQL